MGERLLPLCPLCVRVLGCGRLEVATLDDGTQVKRPIIRLDNGLVVLTRIDPNERKTSMLFRVRPGWEELRRYLAGEVDKKQR